MISIEQTYDNCVKHKQVYAVPCSGSQGFAPKIQRDPFFDQIHNQVNNQLTDVLKQMCPEEFEAPKTNEKTIEVSFVSVEDAIRELQQMEKEGIVQKVS